MEKAEVFAELQQKAKNGNILTMEARWTLIRENNGNPILAIKTDITDRKKLEVQFLRAQRMESVGTLAGGVAHDLNEYVRALENKTSAYFSLSGRFRGSSPGPASSVFRRAYRKIADAVFHNRRNSLPRWLM